MMATMQHAAAMSAPPAGPTGEEGCVGVVVVVRKSGRDGGRFPLAKGTATIGRLESCDIRIALPYVSRKHAELRVEDGKVRCMSWCDRSWVGWARAWSGLFLLCVSENPLTHTYKNR